MKQIRFSAPFSGPVLRVAIAALFVASATQSLQARDNESSNPSGAFFATSAADGGRLIIQRSPVLGHNVRITLKIDGKLAGTLTRGHTYDRYLSPGSHSLVAIPSRSGAAWHGTLDVSRGKTYSYSASFNVDSLVLTPTSKAH